VAGLLVSSHAIDDCARLLLLDPITPPARIAKLAEERETAIVGSEQIAASFRSPRDQLDIRHGCPRGQAGAD
jgi:hypothetical protein